MNCPELERWLDDGMPGADRADALRHAESCGSCAEQLAAAGAVLAMLREEPAIAPPIAAPPGFTNAVLARIEGANEGARAGAFPRRDPWWVTWALDPASVVAITTAVVLAVLARLHPAWFVNPALVWINRTSEWTGAAFANAAAFFHLTAPVWIAIGIGLTPLVVWGVAVFLRRLERLVTLLAAR